MSEQNTGGPAFPRSDERGLMGEGLREGSDGMSLRDYFAARAMEALMQMDGIQFAYKHMEHAVEAYKQADAMLKAREPK